MDICVCVDLLILVFDVMSSLTGSCCFVFSHRVFL